MGTGLSGQETAVQGLASAVSRAAEIAEAAAGTGLEQAALDLYRILLDSADSFRRCLELQGGEEAVAAALLYTGIMQGRAALAQAEMTAEALAAARRRGREEGREEGRQEGYSAGFTAGRSAARRAALTRRNTGEYRTPAELIQLRREA